MNNHLAGTQSLGGTITGLGLLGLEGTADAPSVFNKLLSTTIGILTVIAIIWYLFVFITGAIGIISSGGEKGAYEQARKKITTGLVGLIVVVAAVFVIDLVGYLLGINLILNPGRLIDVIRVK